MLSPEVLQKLDAIEARYEELTASLADPAVASSGERFKKVSKERAGVEPTVLALRAYRALVKEIEDNRALLGEKDADLREMAKEELAGLEPRVAPAEEQLKLFLVPRDPNDDKDVVVEIRAGAGITKRARGKWRGYRSSGVSPVCLAMRASIRGPTSSLSWNEKTKSGQSGWVRIR